MIEVVSLSASGEVVDIAEAETPEAALLAARTLLDDYASHRDVRSGAAMAAVGVGREGMVTVWDHTGRYVGCMGIEKWREHLRRYAVSPETARFELDGKVVSVGFAA